eukprot:scaffold243334_cov19-Tisochrysis_lutea.AAC.1
MDARQARPSLADGTWVCYKVRGVLEDLGCIRRPGCNRRQLVPVPPHTCKHKLKACAQALPWRNRDGVCHASEQQFDQRKLLIITRESRISWGHMTRVLKRPKIGTCMPGGRICCKFAVRVLHLAQRTGSSAQQGRHGAAWRANGRKVTSPERSISISAAVQCPHIATVQ